jgi:hypothetical protein
MVTGAEVVVTKGDAMIGGNKKVSQHVHFDVIDDPLSVVG